MNRPNLMIKVPATIEGLPIVKALIAEGINVNVTLLFSVERYSQVIDAWMEGLEERAAKGLSLKGINSVASFFVSRVDTEADKRMDKKIKEDAELFAVMLRQLEKTIGPYTIKVSSKKTVIKKRKDKKNGKH